MKDKKKRSFEAIDLHVKKQSTKFEMKSSAKFEYALNTTTEEDSLTLNGDKNLLTGINERSNEMDQIHSLIFAILEKLEQRMEKEREDRKKELDDMKSTLRSMNDTM